MPPAAPKQWRVTGVDRDSGHETSIIFSATSAAVARVMAERKGILVAEVIDIEQEQLDAIRHELVGPDATEPPPPARPRPRSGKDIICPNPRCGYVGPPIKQPRGSVAVGCLLTFFFLLPGIFYFIFMRGYRYVCPRCGLQIRSDL